VNGSKTPCALWLYFKKLCALCAFFVSVVIPNFKSPVSSATKLGFASKHFSFFLLDQKETKNQGCRKRAKIYCMPLRRISILATFVFQSANALFSCFKQLEIFAA
jgi:hypothetical protein